MKLIVSFILIILTNSIAAQDNLGALHNAISLKQYKRIDSLVKAGTNLNAEFQNQTALVKALRGAWGEYDTVIVKYLLDLGADPNKGDVMYGTPIAVMASTQLISHRIPFMDLLYRYGAKIKMDQDSQLPEPLDRAIQYNCADASLWLIRHGAEIKSNHLAEMAGSNLTRLQKDKKKPEYLLIDTLIHLTKLPGGRNSEMFTAFGMAIKSGDLALVKRLIEKDSSIIRKNIPEGSGAFPAFILAAYKWSSYPYTAEHLEILKLLVKHGIDINVVTTKDYQQSVTHHNNAKITKGLNALDIAIISQASKEAIAYLRSIGLKETLVNLAQ